MILELCTVGRHLSAETDLYFKLHTPKNFCMCTFSLMSFAKQRFILCILVSGSHILLVVHVCHVLAICYLTVLTVLSMSTVLFVKGEQILS